MKVVNCLQVYFIFYYAQLILISSPIPAGLLSPAFVLGASFGRLYGYILRNIGIFIGIPLVKYEGIYAIVGAASVAGGVTRTLSIAMIIFEVVGQTSHMIPILIGVLLSYAVSSSLSLSAFDALIEIKNLPFLPTLTGYSTYHLMAKDLMNRNFFFLTKASSKLADIAVIIAKVGHTAYTVPVVETDSKKTLLFTVQSVHLRKYLMRRFARVSTWLDPEVRTLLSQYFEALNRLRLGEETPQNSLQDVSIGVKGETESLEPFIGFVHHKDFQINQLLIINNQKPDGPLKDDQEQSFLIAKLERQQTQLEQFWNMPIDFDDEDGQFSLIKDIAPFIVLEDTPMSKLHFLFIMLNISQVNIVHQGDITGILPSNQTQEKKERSLCPS